MPIHFPVLAGLAAASSSSSTKTSAAGSAFSFLFIIILFALAYLLFLRPRSQQAKRQRQEMMTLEVGDEVLTGAGIFGTVVGIEGDRVLLETAPGSQVTVLRSTIARRLTEPEPGSPEHDDWDKDEVTPNAVGKRSGGADEGAGDAIEPRVADNGRGPGGEPEEGRGEGTARTGEGG